MAGISFRSQSFVHSRKPVIAFYRRQFPHRNKINLSVMKELSRICFKRFCPDFFHVQRIIQDKRIGKGKPGNLFNFILNRTGHIYNAVVLKIGFDSCLL